MSNKIMSTATTKVYVAEGVVPATLDKAGFEALTWVLVPDVTSIGTLGGQNSVIQHIPVDDAFVYKVPGSTNYGTLELQTARTDATALDDLRAAFASRAATPVKVVYPSKLDQTDAFMAIVTSVQTNAGGADQILGLNVTVDITGEIITYKTST